MGVGQVGDMHTTERRKLKIPSKLPHSENRKRKETYQKLLIRTRNLASKTKIAQLQLSEFVDQNIGRLEITIEITL